MIIMVSQAMGSVFNSKDIQILKQNFFANIHNNGAIVASPSKQNPNYYYDWIRDSAIALGLIERWYESTQEGQYKQNLYQYVTWTERLQHQPDPLPGQDILGEPKFYVDGTPFSGEWGRPQNDGPALRASTLIRFAKQLLKNNESVYVKKHLYNSSMDHQSMGAIKIDLEYIAHHWVDANYDLWEEVLGHHFFTTMVQQKALIEGAELARLLGDKKAALFYDTQAKLMNARLKQHIDPDHHLIQGSLAPHPGPQKTLELDSSVVLAVLLNPKSVGDF